MYTCWSRLLIISHSKFAAPSFHCNTGASCTTEHLSQQCLLEQLPTLRRCFPLAGPTCAGEQQLFLHGGCRRSRSAARAAAASILSRRRPSCRRPRFCLRLQPPPCGKSLASASPAMKSLAPPGPASADDTSISLLCLLPWLMYITS